VPYSPRSPRSVPVCEGRSRCRCASIEGGAAVPPFPLY
jgi:hypothetical protein